MRLPERLPPTQRLPNFIAASDSKLSDRAIEPQGCNVFEAAACAGAIAACISIGVGVVACLTSAAPHCIKCL